MTGVNSFNFLPTDCSATVVSSLHPFSSHDKELKAPLTLLKKDFIYRGSGCWKTFQTHQSMRKISKKCSSPKTCSCHWISVKTLLPAVFAYSGPSSNARCPGTERVRQPCRSYSVRQLRQKRPHSAKEVYFCPSAQCHRSQKNKTKNTLTGQFNSISLKETDDVEETLAVILDQKLR